MDLLLSDLISDLKDALRTPLLIEIQKKHTDQIIQEKSDFTLENYCKSVFDKDAPANKTNIIIINAKQDAQAQILAQLYELLGSSLKNKKSIESALKLGLYLATLGLSELVDKSITDNVSGFLGKSIDVLDGTVSRWLGNKVEDQAMDTSEEAVDAILSASNASHQLGTDLYLSDVAKDTLLGLATDLSQIHTPHEAMQFTVKFISALGLGAPKLLVVNDPFSLDAESLSLCSLLFSHAKDLKLRGEKAPISVVFNYTVQQPYADNIKSEKNTAALVRLRHMVQRYDMLEKPGSSIPRPAVKSTTFVGRENELVQLKRDHENLLTEQAKDSSKMPHQWTLVRGEPGTGKTALINQYLRDISLFDNVQATSQIRLRLLNQIGHSSEVTGLASLLQSIQSESQRLTQYYEANTNWLIKKVKEKVNDAKQVVLVAKEVADNQLSMERVKKASTSIASLTGYNTIYGSVTAAKDRIFLNKSHKQTADALTEGATQNQKQDQFDRLNSALGHLREIAKEINGDSHGMPIMVFIDDLQWVDELSAEYMLTHLVNRYPLEFLVTARESDSQTSYKLAEAKREHAPYTLQMFDIAKLDNRINHNQFEDTHVTPNQRIMRSIKLLGMDRSTLVSLIKSVYAIDDKVNLGVIADSLIKTLGSTQSADNEQVNTLFVVETLNLLSDAAFYKRFDGVTPLFVKNDKGAYTINVMSATEFSAQVDNVFGLLKNTHKRAYAHDNIKGNEGHQFTLASYAVMEERLFIINQYFAECGDIATFTLQLSSLLASPFNAELVQDIIGRIRTLDEALHSALVPLKHHLNKQQDATLTPEHYELLEEVFEIIRRLPQYSQLHQYRHGLFSAFLRQQTLYTLDGVFEQNDSQEKLVPFFAFVDDILTAKLTALLNDTSDSKSLFEQRINTLEARVALLSVAFENHSTSWAEHYTTALNNLASSYQKVGRYKEDVRLKELPVEILKPLFDEHQERWAERYTTALNNLASSYNRVGRYKEAIELKEQSLTILRSLFDKKTERWTKLYAAALNNLAYSYHQVGRVKQAAELLEESLTILKPLFDINQESWVELYTAALNNLASSYKKVGRNKQAVELLEQALTILKPLFDKYPESWVEHYTDTLNNLALGYQNVGRDKQAKGLLKESLMILKPLFDKYQERWAADYATPLNCLAIIYCEEENYKQAIVLEEQALPILKLLFDKHEKIWAEDYTSSLYLLASNYQKVGRDKQAVELLEESLKILKPLFDKYPKRWVEHYTATLSSLANSYHKEDRFKQAIVRFDQLLVILKPLFDEQREQRWTKLYTSALNNLATSYQKLERDKQALELLEASLKILKPLFDKYPESWTEDYTTTLDNLAASYYNENRFKQAIVVLAQLLAILKPLFDKNPERWTKLYTDTRYNLKLSYFEMRMNDDALKS